MSYIYLASPYSDPSRAIRFYRYTLACQAVAALYKKEVTVFSPIVHCHYIAGQYDMPNDADFWWPHNQSMMERALGMYILNIEGWEQSKGVAQEALFAAADSLPVQMVNTSGDTEAYVKPELWELD